MNSPMHCARFDPSVDPPEGEPEPEELTVDGWTLLRETENECAAFASADGEVLLIAESTDCFAIEIGARNIGLSRAVIEAWLALDEVPGK